MNNTIEMVRGDSESFKVWIEDVSGVVPLVPGDTVYMTIKKSAELIEKEFQAVVASFTDGIAEINITPADTKSMDAGRYVYDVQVSFADGTVKTIVQESPFVLRREVTHE